MMYRQTNVPILMYHSIRLDSEMQNMTQLKSAYFLKKSQFYQQMAYLKASGYNTITLYELLKIYRENKEWNKKYAAITFDDGYLDNYLHAFPILQEFKFQATFFIVTSWMNSKNYLTWDNVQELAKYGMQIHSHTVSHPILKTCKPTKVINELRSSKREIENKLGTEVVFLSYPHGSFDASTVDVAKRVGYFGSCSSRWGFFSKRSDIYGMERIAVRSKLNLDNFKRTINQDRMYCAKIKVLQGIKNSIENFLGTQKYNRLFNFVYKGESYP